MSPYRPGALHHVAPALLYVLAVFYLGSISTDPLAEVSFDWKDKVIHAIVFGGMQLTLARAVRFLWPELTIRRVAVVSAVAATLCGGLLELWQAALPHRTAELLDFLADALGAAVAGVWWARRQGTLAAES
ncbi:MAG: VanZ family protein [Myxococcales bacterium]|nr:VanZ family protein [Myxococcales bacterium]